MFDTSDSPRSASPTDAEFAADTLALVAIGGAARAENRGAYAKVDSATEFHRRWMWRCTHATARMVNAWSHAGWVEIATVLACSTTTASHLVELGVALRDRLPRTRAAFANGDLDHAKAWRLATATAGFGAAATAAAESAALGFAHRYAPAEFTTAIEDALIRTAPDEYARLRKDAQERARRVRRRKLGTMHRIEADLTPAEAVGVWQRIREVAATVCGQDPRDGQQRLVDAYLALMHGEDHLACTCEGKDCTADPTAPSRRTPLVQLTADLATVLGLRNEPAYLPGHGPIDPDLARELAQDATLQPILTELVDLAVTAGLLTPDQAAATTAGNTATEADDAPTHDQIGHTHTDTDTMTDADADSVADTAADSVAAADTEPEAVAKTDADTAADFETDAESDADAAAEPTDQPQAENTTGPTDTDPAPAPAAKPAASPVESALRSRLCHPRLATFIARGSRHRPGVLPSCPEAPKPILVPMRHTYLYDQFTELLATCPELAEGLYPDGHGGLATPPPGVLTYRPSAELAARVRARDRTCRFPGCTVPAAQCQIDHIVSFDHDNPEAGGWTTEANLECLCGFHHELKTVGLWRAVALPGMAILWTGPRGDRHLTLPAGGLTPVPAADLHTAGPGSRGSGYPP